MPARDARFITEALERLAEDIEEYAAATEHLAAQNRVLTDDITDLAHEINQPLAAIMSYAQAGLKLLRMNPAAVDEVAEALERILEQGGRAGEIVHRVRRSSGDRGSPRQTAVSDTEP